MPARERPSPEPAGETSEQLDQRFFTYATTRDPRLRGELVVAHMELARRLSKRFGYRRQFHEDLYQVACMALVKAVDRFRPELGYRFEPFAITTILGELRRYFRDQGWSVRAPRRLQERYLEVRPAVEVLTQRLGRAPTPPQVAEHLGLSLEDVIEALEAANSYQARSLDAMVRDGESSSGALSREDGAFARVDDLAAVRGAIEHLPERERRIVKLRFFDDMTQSEIARQIGLSQMQVSRLLDRSLSTLRRHASDRPGIPLARRRLRREEQAG